MRWRGQATTAAAAAAAAAAAVLALLLLRAPAAAAAGPAGAQCEAGPCAPARQCSPSEDAAAGSCASSSGECAAAAGESLQLQQQQLQQQQLQQQQLQQQQLQQQQQQLQQQQLQQQQLQQQHEHQERRGATARQRFPSNNTVRRVAGQELRDLLAPGSNATAAASAAAPVVLFFFMTDCPHSRAMRPVFDCLPAFFPEQVKFFAVDAFADMNFLALMAQGLHALPVLQVHTVQGGKFRFSGRHMLAPMLRFVSKALGQEPLASLEVAQLCSPTGKEEDAVAEEAAGAGAGRRQRLCGDWQCPTWDGEAVPSQQQHPPLFYLSAAFLLARVLWWLWQRRARAPAGRLAAGAAGERAPLLAAEAAAEEAPAASGPASADGLRAAAGGAVGGAPPGSVEPAQASADRGAAGR